MSTGEFRWADLIQETRPLFHSVQLWQIMFQEVRTSKFAFRRLSRGFLRGFHAGGFAYVMGSIVLIYSDSAVAVPFGRCASLLFPP